MITASRLSCLLTRSLVSRPIEAAVTLCAFCPKKCNAWKKEEIDLCSFLLSWRNAARKKITTPERFSWPHKSLSLSVHLQLFTLLIAFCTCPADGILLIRYCNTSQLQWSGVVHEHTTTLLLLHHFAIEFIECGKLGKMKWDESFYFYHSELFYTLLYTALPTC